MRGILGFVSLLVVLAVVGMIASSQLHSAARGPSAASTAAAASAAGLSGSDRTFGIAPGTGAAADPTSSDAQQIRQIQQQAAEGAARAMQRGTERNERADQAAP